MFNVPVDAGLLSKRGGSLMRPIIDTGPCNRQAVSTYDQTGIVLLFAMVLCALAMGDVMANSLVIDREITGLAHHFFASPKGPGPGASFVHDEVLFDTSGLRAVNLSHYDTFTIRLFAPPGKKLVVNQNSFSSHLNIAYIADNDRISHFASSLTLQFENFVGTLPSRTYTLAGIGDAGNVLEYWVDEAYSTPIEFTAWSYTFSPSFNPRNRAKNFSYTSYSFPPVSFSYSLPSGSPDPGPFVALVDTAIVVTIDIKPGISPNRINRRSERRIAVAILSTPDLDAPTEVDATSLTFGHTGDEPSLASCNESPEDVNNDGLLDLVCQFKTQLTRFQTGDTQGVLKGETVEGVLIKGIDTVRIVP